MVQGEKAAAGCMYREMDSQSSCSVIFLQTLGGTDMEGHRIGVISDTHGLLRPETAAVLKTCEIILHAGDVGKPEVLRQLRSIADTRAVRGNVDSVRLKDFYALEACPEDLPENLPEELETELWGFRIYMIHDKKQSRRDLSGTDLIICGHSHKYEVGRLGNITCLNPGSCGPRRFRLPVTMMLLTLYPAEHRLETERIDWLATAEGKTISNAEASEGIPQSRMAADGHMKRVCGTGQGGRSGSEEEMKIPEQDMYRLIRQIMKDVDAGRRIPEIAVRHHIDEGFTEQVCRMYLTHPGVDVDGILDRMERKNIL